MPLTNEAKKSGVTMSDWKDYQNYAYNSYRERYSPMGNYYVDPSLVSSAQDMDYEYLPDGWEEGGYLDAVVGPHGEVLPPGALGWKATGDPYYGDGLAGLANRLSGRTQEQRRKWREEAGAGMYLPGALASTSKLLDEKKGSQKFLSWMRDTVETSFTIAGQWWKKPIDTLFTGLQEFGENIPKKTLATVPLAVESQATLAIEQTGDRNYDEWLATTAFGRDQQSEIANNFSGKIPDEFAGVGGIGGMREDYDPQGWIAKAAWGIQNSIRGFFTDIIPRTTYNAAIINKAIQETGTNEWMADPWEAVSAAWKEGSMAYSYFADNSLHAEYSRRLANGEYLSPVNLAETLADPETELGMGIFVGFMGVEPTDFVFKALGKSWSAWRSAHKLGTEMDFIDDGVKIALDAVEKAGKNPDIIDDAVEGLVDAVSKSAKTIGTNADELQKSFGILQYLPTGKVFQAVRRASTHIGWIAANFNNQMDDAMEILRAGVMMVGDNPDEVREGIEILSHMKGGGQHFSRSAIETYHFIRKSLGVGADGVVDYGNYLDKAQKLADNLAKVTIRDGEDYYKAFDEWVDFTVKKVAGVAEDMYKPAKELIKEGVELSAGARVASWLTDTGPLARMNAWWIQKISNLYMGYSPGYAVRNAIANRIQMFLDYGDMSKGNKVFGTQNLLDDIARMTGGQMPAGVMEGAGPIGTKRTVNAREAQNIVEAFRNGKSVVGAALDAPMARLAAWAERNDSIKIIHHVITDTLDKGLVVGHSIPDVQPLIDAGIPPDAVDVLVGYIRNTQGNVDEAVGLFTKAIKNKTVRIVPSTSWIDKKTQKALKQARVWDSVVDACSLDNYDDFVEAIKKIPDEVEAKTLASVLRDHPSLEHADEIYQDLVKRGMDETFVQGIVNQEVANIEAQNALFEELDTAFFKMRDELLSTPGITPEQRETVLRIFTGDSGLLNNIRTGHTTVVKNAADAKRIWMDTFDVVDEFDKMDGTVASKAERLMDRLGIDWEIPDFTRRQDFRDFMFDVYARPAVQNSWGLVREQYFDTLNGLADTAIRELNSAGFADIVRPPTPRADKLVAEARQIQHSIIDEDGFVFSIGGKILEALEGNEIAKGVRYLAMQYGFGPSKFNKRWDRMLMSILTANGHPAITKLDDVDWDLAVEALENYRSMRGWKGLFPDIDQMKNLRNLADDAKDAAVQSWVKRTAGEWDGLPTFARSGTGSPNAVLKDFAQDLNYNPRIVLPDDMADLPLPNGLEVKEFDVLGEKFKIVVREGGDVPTDVVDDLTKAIKDGSKLDYEEAQRLFGKAAGWSDEYTEYTIKARNARLDYIDRTSITETMRRALSGVPGITEPIVPPLNGAAGMPDEIRMIHGGIDQLRSALDDLATKADSIWTATTTDVDPKAFKNVADWMTEAKSRIAFLRKEAVDMANEARAFTLHDYDAKRGFDKVLQFTHPYAFWYTRTYAKWITQRILDNPQVISDYMKYRRFLENKHAGYPDWWRWNVNTNEVFGLDSDNPFFFNIEAIVNPMNGLTGVDFNDPDKRVDKLTNVVNELGKFGPSVNPIITWTMGLAYYLGAEDEWNEVWEGAGSTPDADARRLAGAKWMGRLLPQSVPLKAMTSYFTKKTAPGIFGNVWQAGGIDIDPFAWIQGGQDPYEERRIGRAAGALIQRGEPREAVMDSIMSKSGEYWDAAQKLAASWRAPGQISSFLFGVGFKGRTQEDVQIDKFYTDYYDLMRDWRNMPPEQAQYELRNLFIKYPFGETVILASKNSVDRDRTFAYNVMNRIPPGEKNFAARVMGMDTDLLSKFYDTNGDFSTWTEEEKSDFMEGITDMAAVLAIPEQATKDEWNQASNAYKSMRAEGEKLFGKDIWDMVGVYYGKRGDSNTERNASYDYLDDNPIVDQALDWQAEQIANSPILSAYYGGFDKIQRYYLGKMNNHLERELGQDIFDRYGYYYTLKNTGFTDEASEYWKENKEDFDKMWDIKDAYYEAIDQRMVSIVNRLPHGRPPEFREDMPQEYQDEVEEYMQEYISPIFDMSLPQWNISLGGSTVRLILSDSVPPLAEEWLRDQADALGVEYEELLLAVQNAEMP